MRIRTAALSICLILMASLAWGQTRTLQGRVVDEEGAPLPSATVMLTNKADSVLAGFALTNSNGKFSVAGVPEGTFELKVTLLEYVDLKREVSLGPLSPETVDLGDVEIISRSTLLGDVEITGERIPVQIKGDTIEYDALAFKTQPNASVEDLLKRMPGVEVDGDGNVKAQGETVTKVLVDGKEFFGDDPKLATKNLPADAVSKVQVFDKASDMAEFTGIDDGNEARTINLMLKEDHKTGYFGNVMAGYGTENRFQGKANLNRFTEKSQLSLLGMGNNVNEQSFSVRDYISFMGGLSNVLDMNGGGFNMDRSNMIIPVGMASNNGITTTGAGGLNYNQELGTKTKISGSYFYNYLGKDLNSYTYRENILENQQFITEDSSTTDDKNYNHRVSLRIKQDLDSTSQLIFNGNGSLNQTESVSFSGIESYSRESLQNSSFRDQLTNGGSMNASGNLTYRKKFRKRGRFIAATGTFGLNDLERDIALRSENSLMIDTAGLVTVRLDQDQAYLENKLDWGAKLSYTEPLGKRVFWESFYAHQVNANDLVKDFYNLRNNTSEFDSLLSNRYDGGYNYDQVGTNFKYVAKQRSNVTVGVAAQRSALDGLVGLQDSLISKRFFNVLPSLRLRHQIRKGRDLRFTYRTTVNMPTIEELQPVVDNSNPLSLYVGNPDLKAEYSHSARANYVLFDMFSFTTLYVGLNATHTRNKISQSTTVDSLFRQITTPVNVDADTRVGVFVSFETPIRKLGIKIGIDPSSSYNRGITLINGVENPTNRFSNDIDMRIENRGKDVFDLIGGVRFSHNLTQYAIDAQRNQEFLTTRYYGEATVYIKKGWSLSSRMDYTVYSGGGFDDNQAIPLWRAHISKTFLRGQAGELKLFVFDILNQNQGVDRTTEINYLEETRANALGRYGMLSFTYKIMQLGKKR